MVPAATKCTNTRSKPPQDQDAAMRNYVRSVATPDGGAADEITQLANLRDKGMVSEEEFQQGKAKALG
jgi:Short C-terminal domain